MSEDLKWFFGLALIPITWFVRLVWNNHIDLRSIKDTHPTWEEMHKTIRQCSDEKDKDINALKEDTRYIRDKMDKLIDMHVNRNDR